jgi:hypothetical protein
VVTGKARRAAGEQLLGAKCRDDNELVRVQVDRSPYHRVFHSLDPVRVISVDAVVIGNLTGSSVDRAMVRNPHVREAQNS